MKYLIPLLLVPSLASAGEASVKCTPPKGDAYTRVNYYYGTAKGVYVTAPWFKDTTGDCSIVIKNLTPGTTYFVIAKLVNNGVEGPSSNEVTKVATSGAAVLE